jgi:thiol-disulfide isomerase/thioredoxin
VAELPPVRPPPKSNKPEDISAKELGGGVALARLFTGSGSEAGRMAPDFELPALDGSEVALRSVRGKVVMLNFWAPWCGACRSEMPALEGLYRDLRSNPDFALITVSGSGRGAGPVAQFIEERLRFSGAGR